MGINRRDVCFFSMILGFGFFISKMSGYISYMKFFSLRMLICFLEEGILFILLLFLLLIVGNLFIKMDYVCLKNYYEENYNYKLLKFK